MSQAKDAKKSIKPKTKPPTCWRDCMVFWSVLFMTLTIFCTIYPILVPVSHTPVRPPHTANMPAHGTFMPTPYGRTYYQIYCLDDIKPQTYEGLLTVFVHGMSLSSEFSWPPNIVERILTHSGESKCGLVYDLYGRGNSDSPPPSLVLNERAYITQLSTVLFALSFREAPSASKRLNVVGHSLGGGIAVAFTAQYAHMVKRLVLTAPVGLPFTTPWYSPLTSYIPAMFVPPSLVLAFLTEAYKNEYSDTNNTLVKEKLAVAESSVHKNIESNAEGYIHSLLGTISNFPGIVSGDLAEEILYINYIRSTQVTVIWGDKDTVVPFEDLFTFWESALRNNGKFHVLKNVGHDVYIHEPVFELIGGALQ